MWVEHWTENDVLGGGEGIFAVIDRSTVVISIPVVVEFPSLFLSVVPPALCTSQLLGAGQIRKSKVHDSLPCSLRRSQANLILFGLAVRKSCLYTE